jgi:hypothetical protein
MLKRSLHMHNHYFCGPDAVRSKKQAKQERSKQKESTLKAMKTLKITKDGDELPEGAGGSGKRAKKAAASAKVPEEVAKKSRRNTPMAIYNDLMREAGRKPMDMGEKPTGSDDDTDAETSEDEALSAPVSTKRGIRGRKSVPKAAAAAAAETGAASDRMGSKPTPVKQTVAQLKEQLAARGLLTSGNKMVLIDRLGEADEESESDDAAAAAMDVGKPPSKKLSKKAALTKKGAMKKAPSKGPRKGKSPKRSKATAEPESEEIEDDGDKEEEVVTRRASKRGRTHAEVSTGDTPVVDTRATAATAATPTRRKKGKAKAKRAAPLDDEASASASDGDVGGAADVVSRRTSSPRASKARAKTALKLTIKSIDVGDDAAEDDSGSEFEVPKVESSEESSASEDVSSDSDSDFVEASTSRGHVVPIKKLREAAVKGASGAGGKSGAKGGKGGKGGPRATARRPKAPPPPAGAKVYAKEGEVVDQEGFDLRSSLLHCVKWHRIVLDEAHKIKERTNSTAKAVFGLNGSIRWCLSGTPLQNRIGELFALIRFIQVRLRSVPAASPSLAASRKAVRNGALCVYTNTRPRRCRSRILLTTFAALKAATAFR